MFTLYWIIKRALGRLDYFEEGIVADFFGLASARMKSYYKRLFTANFNDFTHALVNIPVEWTRMDPQRAAKIGIMDQALVWSLLIYFEVI
jgi:hypothetical protein